MRRSARLASSCAARLKLDKSATATAPVLAASVKTDPTLPAAVTAENGPLDGWISLCSSRELSCALTLESGQVFSWRRHPTELKMWLGVVGDRVFALRENDSTVQFKCLHPLELPGKQAVEELSYYFRLDMEAEPLYTRWTKPADRMADIISRLRGLRIVRQDPVECLFSFICSSNNDIARIQAMVDNLKATYGELLYTYEQGAEEPRNRFYTFPSVDTLAEKCQEETLRALGFGYRAAFIVKSAKQLQALGGASYLHKIRDGESVQPKAKRTKRGKDMKEESASYHDYQDELMVFAGVGRKVADCVALFSLEKLEAIPVDTHVWQIACREFDASLSDQKSITPSVYLSVGDLFRARFSPQAGWAHSVLFAGDLSAFKSALPDGVKNRKPKPIKAKAKAESAKPKASKDFNRV